ncbi:MAG: metallophosphoesterase family protein [Bacteroidota bacterium]
MNIKILFLLLFLLNFTVSIKNETVKGVIEKAVAEIYNTIDSKDLNTLTDKFVLNLFNHKELNILATKYWYFDINTPSIVSVMRSTGQNTVPFWLPVNGFIKTGLIVKNEYYTYEVWQKEYNPGRVELGINGFDDHNKHYFVSVKSKNEKSELTLKNFFPANQFVTTMDIGAFTYHDWDELTLTVVPDQLKGGKLLTTIRGRSREAHLINAFRETPFPSSEESDQVMLTWSKSTKSTQSVQWRTDTTSNNGVVRYWKKGDDKDNFIQTEAERKLMEDRMLQNDRFINRHTALIANLKPNTTYNYIVGNPDNNKWSDTNEFKTEPESTDQFSFVYFGDTHKSPQWGQLINDSYKRFPDVSFYTLGGDMVASGLFRNDWDIFFNYAEEVIKNKPLMPVLGNHDDQNGLGAKMYIDLFDLPENGPDKIPGEYSYSFKYGNALFLMLASTRPINEQSAWIENQLKNSDATWKFAIFHFPPYSADEDYPNIRKEWGNIFDKYHVDMVFSGHVHYYMRTKPMFAEKPVTKPSDGTIYIVSVAVPARELSLPDKNYVEVRSTEQDYYYQKVDINGSEFNYKTYNSSGILIDSLNIIKQ